MDLDLVIRGGRVVTPQGVLACDVGVAGGRIAALAPRLSGARVLEAAGRWVMPGGVDPHAHIEQVSGMGLLNADSFETATAAAALGGTTTVISFAAQARGERLADTLAAYAARAARGSRVDHAFHLTITDLSVPGFADDLRAAIVAGHRSVKLFTTYAIGLIKTGLVQDPALAAVGRLEWIDLGLPQALLQSLPADQPLGLGQRDLANRPRPRLHPGASKYQRGRLLVVAGSEAYRGAASLVLAGAGSSGCGSLRAALPQALANQLWQLHPHVVVSQTLACHAHGSLRLDPLTELDRQRLDAVLIGPGIGPLAPPMPQAGPGEADCWRSLLAWPGLLVLDADGLNRLAGPVAQGLGLNAASWLQQRQGPSWITPHPGEFARLFPELEGRPALEAAAQAAQASGACVLLKGARSVVAAPDGRRWQLLEASPSSARAGLGDVLAGHVAGLGAMAMAATGHADATWLAAAALAHAQAGLQCTQNGGPGAASPMEVARTLANLC